MSETDAARVAVDAHLAIVVDDDAKVRQFIESTLTQLGMKVASFDMAKEALASLDDNHPALIFLDVALLQSDAIDVLRGLGERRYRGIVQLMSGGRPSLLEAIQRIGVRRPKLDGHEVLRRIRGNERTRLLPGGNPHDFGGGQRPAARL